MEGRRTAAAASDGGSGWRENEVEDEARIVTFLLHVWRLPPLQYPVVGGKLAEPNRRTKLFCIESAEHAMRD